MPFVPVYGSTGAQRAPCAAPAARAAPGTAPFAAPASGEPPAAARAARAALRDYSRRARTQPRRQRRLASAGSPPRRVLPQRCRAGAPRRSGRPPASRQSAWGAPGAGGSGAAAQGEHGCVESRANAADAAVDALWDKVRTALKNVAIAPEVAGGSPIEVSGRSACCLLSSA